MDHLIDAFVNRLSQSVVCGPVFNQYAAREPLDVTARANAIRRQNLRLYLQHMAAAGPQVVLVGEAPGYRGCRLTGVPFTSEAILLNGTIWPFGPQAGYRKTAERQGLVKEATATMVWSSLVGLQRPPLFWNAFPFHPHQPERPDSNRPPSAGELEAGGAILAELMQLFPMQVVAAVGRSAARAMARAGIRPDCLLRHPSHGGKASFQAGLAQIGLIPDLKG